MKNNKLNILLHSISSVCIHIQYISYVFNYMNTIEAKNFGSEDKYKVIMRIFLKLEMSSATSLKLF